MSLIDIGVNFHASQLRGVGAELVARAAAAGVTRILATGTSLASSVFAVAFAREHPGVWATAGVHPHGAADFTSDTATALEPLWADARVVAVGECGLDYHRMFSPQAAQRARRGPLLHRRRARGRGLSRVGPTGYELCYGRVRRACGVLASGKPGERF